MCLNCQYRIYIYVVAMPGTVHYRIDLFSGGSRKCFGVAQMNIDLFLFISNILLINQYDWITGYAYAKPLQQQDGTI